MLQKLTLRTKNILFASIITILLTIGFSIINYFMNMNDTINRLSVICEKTVQAWSKDVTNEEVEKIINHDIAEQKKAIAYFDRLAEYQPHVAQGYLFGVELVDGTGTSVISGPSFLMNDFDKSGLHVGDIYTQPQVIADAIKDMKETHKLTTSSVYTDDYGKWLTVLKPLFNEQGEMFAYYGIDFDAQPYLNAEAKKLKMMILFSAIVLTLVCITQYIFMTNLFKPISALKVSMRKIAVGDYSTKLKESQNELGQLSKQFNKMSTAIANLLESIKETTAESTVQANQLTSTVKETHKIITNINQNIPFIKEKMQSQNYLCDTAVTSTEILVDSMDTVSEKITTLSKIIKQSENQTSAGLESFAILKHELMQIQNTPLQNHTFSTSKSSELISTIGEMFQKIQTNNLLVSSTVQEVYSVIENLSVTHQHALADVKISALSSEENTVVIEKLVNQLQMQFDSFDKISASTKNMNDIISELEVLVYAFKH